MLTQSLFLRVLSALVLGPLVLLASYAGGPWFLIVVVIITIIGLHEWFGMCVSKRNPQDFPILLPLGFLYILVACIAFWWLRQPQETGAAIILWLLATVWAMDTGAYFAGTIIGGPKLAPTISPNKTWAGLIGGVLATCVAGYFAHAQFSIGKALLPIIIISAFVGVCAQIGDLMESGAKRFFNVKDSSHIIPGHGGVLDRIDGLLAASVAIAGVRLFASHEVGLW